MIDLKFTVSEFGKITRTDLTPVISDSIGWYSATFTFHASWSESKTALFKNGDVEAEAVLVNNTCVIPSTVLAEHGDIRVSVYCGERKTANVSKVQLTPSGYFEATPPAPPEPTQVVMYTFSDASGVRMFRYLDSKLEWYNGSVWTEVITDISGKLDKNFTAFTAETAMVDTDLFPMNKINGTLKKTAWSLIKSTLKTAHDLLYIPRLFNDLESLDPSDLAGSAILPVNKSGLLNKISFNTLSSYLMEYSTYVSLTTVAQTIKGAINELVTTIGNKLAKTTNITAIDDTGIADGEIPVFNLTAKKLETSNVLIGDVLKTTPVATVTITGNTEYVVTVADVDTDFFTSVGHGLVNANVLFPVRNNTTDVVYPLAVFAGGLVVDRYYFVVNKTDDTFQLSLTSGGAPINITTNATVDLTKWHFEKVNTANITISSLPPAYAYRTKITGRRLGNPDDFFYITPNAINPRTSVFINSTSTSYTFALLSGISDIGLSLETVIDFRDKLTINHTGMSVKSSSASAFAVTSLTKQMMSFSHSATLITSIVLTYTYFANGTIVEVYNA
jgi:hypothetical protein